MPKNERTPRSELICGKLDALHAAVVAGEIGLAINIIEAIRHDAERMGSALMRRKKEAASLNRELDVCNLVIERQRGAARRIADGKESEPDNG